MPKPRVVLAAVAAAAGVVTLAPAAASAAPAGRAPVRVHIARNHTVAAPATVHPGRANLHNSGSGVIVAFQPLHGGSSALLARDLAGITRGEGGLFRDFAILAVLRAHKSVYTPLYRGRVLFFDAGTDKPSASDIRTMRVAGAREDAVIPASVPFVISPGNALSAPAHVPTRGYFAFVNNSRGPQEILLVRVGSHVTQQTIDSVVAHPSPDALDTLQPTDFRVLGPVSGEHRAWTQYWLGAGRWVAFTAAFHAGGARALVVG